MTRHTLVLNIAILLLGVSSVHMHGMNELTKEDFITQLYENCTNNNNVRVEKLLKKLDGYDYADEIKSNNNALHIICNTLNDNPQDDPIRGSTKKILVRLLDNNFNPNAQDKNGNTPLHILRPLSTNIRILRSLRNYGANVHMKNNDNKDSYCLALENKPEQNYFATIDRAYTRWKDLLDYTGWQEDRGYRPKSIRKRYRYLFANTNQEELQNSDGLIVFVVVHDTGTPGESGHYNKDYYNPKSSIFRSFMNYAKAYVEHYNNTKEQQQEFKIPHLISFLWNRNLLDPTSNAGLKLAKYLDSWNYRNAKIVLIAPAFSCDVVSFASHKLRNTGKKNNDNLYEGRIEEIIFFAPPRRPKILDVLEKDSIINSLEMINVRIACNDIVPIEPTNYGRLFVFYSPTIGDNFTDETLGKHMYNVKFPINELDQVEGPKIYIKTMADGKYIGHNSPKLLENFATVLKILKTQYTLNIARCNAFKVNIVTDKKTEEQLLQFIESESNKALFNEFENSNNNDQHNNNATNNHFNDQYKKFLTFWENRKDNCKVQCMPINRKGLDEDFFKKCNNSQYSMAAIKTLKIAKGNKFDSQDFANITELIGEKHQRVYEHCDKSAL